MKSWGAGVEEGAGVYEVSLFYTSTLFLHRLIYTVFLGDVRVTGIDEPV